MYLILWLIAVVLIIFGIIKIINGEVLLGAILIVVGLLVGPGGVSIFSGDDGGEGVRPQVTEEWR